MKAIILAAGLGSRLRPVTNEMPKCMVLVNGQPIIHKQISNLLENGINESDIVVVAGYKAEVLDKYIKDNFPNINVINNARYSETNNMFSLYLAMKNIGKTSFLLMNADVFMDENVISGLLDYPSDNAIAVDDTQYLEESMKVCVTANGKITHISKAISEEDHFAVSIDVYKISSEAAAVLMDVIHDFIELRNDENSWTEVALDKIFVSEEFYPYIIQGRWVEIDNHNDLINAEKLFQ